jgi:integral membrane protein (TIGR01906 family)
VKKLLALAIAAFFLANFAMSLTLVSFNDSFFETFYQKNETASQLDMSLDDLMKGTTHLLDYIQEKEDNLNVEVVVNGESVSMYNQREIDHMVDVVDLFNLLKTVQLLSYAFFGIMILYWLVFQRKTLVKDLFEASKLALAIIGVIMGSILIVAVVDFNWFWTVFHQTLFDNELWLLNPNTDRLIVMVPLDFFKQLVFSIVLGWLASLALWFGVLGLLIRRRKS